MECTDATYFFRFAKPWKSFVTDYSQIITISGGVGPFSWNIFGVGFELGFPYAEGRSNVVTYTGDESANAYAELTIYDSCSNSISGSLLHCVSYCGEWPHVKPEFRSGCPEPGTVSIIYPGDDLECDWEITFESSDGKEYYWHIYLCDDDWWIYDSSITLEVASC